jgi:3-oxoadipate enol-lactonase
MMAYDDMGKGAPIIFLHGFPFNKSMWQPQYDSLKQHFRIIAPDLRSFGYSKDDTSELSMDLFADDVIALMDELNLDKVAVCGLSMGGYIALNAIQRYPERFNALFYAILNVMPTLKKARQKDLNLLMISNQMGLQISQKDFLKMFSIPKHEQ